MTITMNTRDAVRFESDSQEEVITESIQLTMITWEQVIALTKSLTSFSRIGNDSPASKKEVTYVNSNRVPEGVISHVMWENDPICGRTGPVRDGCPCATVHTVWWGFHECDLDRVEFKSRSSEARIVIRKVKNGYLAEFHPGWRASRYWDFFTQSVTL